MIRHLVWVVVMCGLLSGCVNLPETYAPPPQRPFFEAPPEATRVLNMADDDAESHFVKDIGAELQGNRWRWTGKRPTIRLRTGSDQKLLFAMDFAIAGATFEKTGPVTLAFYVNDRLLGRATYDAPGAKRFEKPVPADWLEGNENVTLAAEIDKVWTPPQPGSTPLGFLLVALGLVQTK